jgi:predicted dehydrogenase
VKVGVVGVGHLGQHHARVYSELPGVELVGVVDSDPARAREIADRHGVAAFGEIEELVPRVDAVSIVTPTPEHLASARPFLQAGRGVLVEKPLAATLEEADELLALAERGGATLQVGHIERFNPCLVAALPRLDRPLFIEADRIHPFSLRSTEVSVVLDLMIHDIDLVLHVIPDDLVELSALGTPVFSPTDDLALAILRFSGGQAAMVKTSRVAMNRSRKIRVFCAGGYLSLDLVARQGMHLRLADDYDPREFLDASGRLVSEGGEEALLARALDRELLEIPEYEPLKAELEAFVSAVRDRSVPVVTGLQGRRAMEAAERVMGEIRSRHEALRAGDAPRGG